MARMRTGKQVKLTPEERSIQKAKNEVKREKFESQNMGKYILLYPLSDKIKSTIKAKNESESSKLDSKNPDYIPDQSIMHQENETDESKQTETKKKQAKRKDGKKIKLPQPSPGKASGIR